MTDNKEIIFNNPSEMLALAKRHQNEHKHDMAIILAEAVEALTGDQTLINQANHIIGISGYYSKIDSRKQMAKDISEKMSLDRTLSWHDRDTARKNLTWYIPGSQELFPSVEIKQLNFTNLKPLYSPMNPSLAVKNDKVWMIQRTVNYKITPSGAYDMQGDNAIRTTNYLVQLDDDMNIVSSEEILPPKNLPDPKYTAVIGWEDCRLFVLNDEFWCTSTVRELTEDGWCNIVLSKIARDENGFYRFTDYRIIEPTFIQKQSEKNWMPFIVTDKLYFLYSCDPVRIIDSNGNLMTEQQSLIASDSFRGGGSIIPFDGHWLAIIHEANLMPDHRRRYSHRFVLFDHYGKLIKYSDSFYFNKLGIEFAAGLAIHPKTKKIIVGFGVDDRQSYIGLFSPQDISNALMNMPTVNEIVAANHRQNNYIKQMDKVYGWLENDTAEVISFLMNYQSRQGTNGNILEIGTFYGRLFCLLANGCLPNETAIGIDLFENQGSNQDNSGRSFNRSILENNLKEFASCSSYEIIEQDSTQLDINFVEKYKGIRFVSVDGSHTWKATVSDLTLSQQLLCPGGIVAIDDIFRIDWAGVTNGIFAYLHQTDRSKSLVPFCIVPNKLLLTTDEESAKKYQHILYDRFKHLLAKNNQEWREFFFDTKVLIIADPEKLYG